MVKSVTVPGKCYAISDGDRQDDPNIIHHFIQSKLICEMTYISLHDVIQIYEFTHVNSYINGLKYVN